MTEAVTTRVLDTVLADLADEADDLAAILDALDDAGWATATPAPGWTVHDQVCHLAHFDWVTRLALTAPDDFARLRDALGADHGRGLQDYVDSIGPANASRRGPDVLAWWREQGVLLREAVAAASPEERVPWFGPPMSLASKVTARLMETWAHGQDVADALGIRRTPTDRLRHVARIGVLALPNSFAAHGRDVPDVPLHVALTLPSGATVEWGDQMAEDRVTGAAADFCLVVTRRRHAADTDLEVRGTAAAEWIDIAQAYAGPPGAGRSPGQLA